MRFIPTQVHGCLDYSVSLLVIAAPRLLGFARSGAETWVPVASGLASTIYSMFTDYELGIRKRIPMPVHLILDMAGGALLAASPWIFRFARRVWRPHVALGLLEVIVPLFTRRRPASNPSLVYNPVLGY